MFYSFSLLLSICIFCMAWLSGLEVICLCFPFPPPLFLSFSSPPLLLEASIELLYWDWNSEDVGWLSPPPPKGFSLLKTTRFQNSNVSQLSEFWILLLISGKECMRISKIMRSWSQLGGELVQDRGAFVKKGRASGKKEEKMFFRMRP